MEIIFTLISLFAICVLSLFFAAILKIQTSVAPLVAVSFTMVYLTVFGMLGLLLLGGYLYFLCTFAIIVLFAVKKLKFPQLSPWFYAFVIISGALIVFFGIRQPLLTSWDEFSFWGTAVKMTKLNNELHTTAEIGWVWVASQKPGLIVLGYFFQFFGAYAQWKVFIGVNILAISLFTALLTPFKEKAKIFAVPLFLVLFFTPYIFTVYRETQEPLYIYINALSDVPMAWLFCAVLAVYYISKQAKSTLLPVYIASSALMLTRDTALPFALIAWAIISFDILFINSDVKFLKLEKIKAKILHVFLMLCTVLACFFVWAWYISSITGADPLGNIGGSEEMSMAAMLVQGITQLFGINVTEHFALVMGRMFSAFFTLHMSMIGTGLFITVFILIIVAIAALCASSKEHRLSCICFGIFSFLGFIAYYIFIGFTFVFIFKDDTSLYLIGYERYIYPYYIGWFAAAMYMLCVSAASIKGKLYFLPQGTVFFILLIFANRFNAYVPQGMTFLDYHDGYLYERKEIVSTAQNLVEILGKDEDGKIYFVSQGDNGNRWFQYSGEVLPLQLDYSFGGGTLTTPENSTGGAYDYAMSLQEFTDYIDENGCEYIFVERSNPEFVHDFGALFSDNLQLSANGESVVYEVVKTNDSLAFNLISEVG